MVDKKVIIVLLVLSLLIFAVSAFIGFSSNDDLLVGSNLNQATSDSEGGQVQLFVESNNANGG